MAGAAHPLLMLPLRLFGLRGDRGDWCSGCAHSVNGTGIMAWTVLVAAMLWLAHWVA
ncbi:hypothetical protein ACTJIL_00150 [Luteimonas sp. 22616]|uniref:hypothetical protein n=1 Tax=Luteimonas sp. 22616 TaxID=3453951 RepID=UPI003F84A596